VIFPKINFIEYIYRIKTLGMEAVFKNRSFAFKSLFDIAAVLLIVLIPAATHLTGIPVYFLEPMRVMLILAMLHTDKRNALLLAVLLPVASFVFSGHPFFVKMLIITGELLVNVMLFYFLAKKFNGFISMIFSIVSSKLLCYTTYYLVFGGSFVLEESGKLFIAAQLIMTLLLSAYTAVTVHSGESKT
jgi:hypothetical protein